MAYGERNTPDVILIRKEIKKIICEAVSWPWMGRGVSELSMLTSGRVELHFGRSTIGLFWI
jgi:hypothetical protein